MITAHPYPTLFQHLATDTTRNLVITAGAGTGKTATLTRRIIRILREQQISLDRIIVVTFTEKAAVEMKERIYAAIETEIENRQNQHFLLLRDHFLNNRISTFHAFCASLLREYPVEAGIDPYFRVMDEEDKVFFLRKIINNTISGLAADKNHPDLSLLCSEFSRTGIANAVYTIIQKREDAGSWLESFMDLTWKQYKERLPVYQDAIIKELCFKCTASGGLDEAGELLMAAVPDPPGDDSVLSQRRNKLLELIPILKEWLLKSGKKQFDTAEVCAVRNAILKNLNLKGSNANAWQSNPENLRCLKEAVHILRSLLAEFNIEEYEINWPVEEEGFGICKALARVAVCCLDSYREEKLKENLLDFQDLQLKVLVLLKSAKNSFILEELREKFLYIMVDEFQDTNSLQWSIIKAIASDQKKDLFGDRLFIVGDEKQAIYSFRGGDVTLFARARRELLASNKQWGTDKKPFSLLLADQPGNEKDYTDEYRKRITDKTGVKTGRIEFSENFRSAREPVTFFNLFFNKLLQQKIYEDYEARPQQIICAGNRRRGSVELLLVDKNAKTPDDSMNTDDEDPGEIDLHTREAAIIAAKIREVLLGDNDDYAYVREQAARGKPAIAILLRRRTKLKTYEEALRRESIDFIVVRGRGFYQRQEITDLGNLLGFLADRSHSIYLAGYLRSPTGHVPDQGIYMLSRISTGETLWEKLNIFAGLNNEKDLAGFTEQDICSLQQAYSRLCRYYLLSRRMVLVDFIRLILDEEGWHASLCRGARGEQAVSNVEKLLDRAREATLNNLENFFSFAGWLNERIDYIEEEGEADIDATAGGAVQLMTVHQSKGLEFPLVIVPDLAAHFNFGKMETLRFDDVTYNFKVDGNEILREMRFETGICAPDPANKYEPTPTLVRKIIEKRSYDKIIAEMKRLLYVAVTRTMDHLILVGQVKLQEANTDYSISASQLNQLKNWMDWISKILNLPAHVNPPSGTLMLADDGEQLGISYKVFDENTGTTGYGEELRSEFPV